MGLSEATGISYLEPEAALHLSSFYKTPSVGYCHYLLRFSIKGITLGLQTHNLIARYYEYILVSKDRTSSLLSSTPGYPKYPLSAAHQKLLERQYPSTAGNCNSSHVSIPLTSSFIYYINWLPLQGLTQSSSHKSIPVKPLGLLTQKTWRPL